MIVVDTSVIVKLAIPEARSDLAAKLRLQILGAPAIWRAEVANVLWRKVRVGEIGEDRAAAFLRALFDGVIVTLQLDDDLVHRALAIAMALNHPVYDCFFLACAIDQNTVVVTDDSRFGTAVVRHGRWSKYLRMLESI
ncbi:MAG TPA: type II toxin-antitoxin system VapC family toxin [Rhizomicrobium sp.]